MGCPSRVTLWLVKWSEDVVPCGAAQVIRHAESELPTASVARTTTTTRSQVMSCPSSVHTTGSTHDTEKTEEPCRLSSSRSTCGRWIPPPSTVRRDTDEHDDTTI